MGDTVCYLCGGLARGSQYSISICEYCQETEPALASGIEALQEIGFTSQLEPFISGITWFDLRKTAARHTGRSFQREHFHSVKVQQAVEGLSQQIQRVGQKSALTYFHLFNAMGEMWAQNDHLGSATRYPAGTIKLAVGLAASSHIEQETSTTPSEHYPDPSGVFGTDSSAPITSNNLYGVDLHSLIELLGILFQACNNLNDNSEDFDPLKDLDRVRASVRRANISASDFLYSGYSVETMERLYTPFNLALLQEFGFEIRDVRDYSMQMLDFFYHRRKMLYQVIRWYHADVLRVTGSFWERRDEIGTEDFSQSTIGKERLFAEKVQWSHVLDSATRLLWFDEEVLRAWTGAQNLTRFSAFLDRISTEVGEVYFREPYSQLNPLEKHPLVKCDGKYLVPLPTQFADAVLNTFYHDLFEIDDRIQGDRSQIWGDVIEYWAIDSVQKLFPDVEVRTGVDLGDLETDILLQYDDTVVLFEVKSKQLTKESFQGETDAIREDFSKGIGEAASQLSRRIDYLRETDEEALKRELDIDLHQVNEYLPIGVMSTTYGDLATTEYTRLLEGEITPYIVSAHHLDLISRVLETPAEFVLYVRERIKASESGFFVSDDELDFLGYFVRKGDLRPTFKEVEELAESNHTEVLNSIGGFRAEVEDQLADDNAFGYIRWLESSQFGRPERI